MQNSNNNKNKVSFQITFVNVPDSMLRIFESQKIDVSKEIFVPFNRAENLDIMAQMGSLYKLDDLRQEIERLTSEAVNKAFDNLNLSN